MTELHSGVELWLTAERQQMARPEALTAFLSDKAAMLDTVRLAPEDVRNKGAAKARSHIDGCVQLVSIIETLDDNHIDKSKKLADLASKALKVASGYSMRAGYFHPNQPETLYRDRMVRLIDANGEKLPVLGVEIEKIERSALDIVMLPDELDSVADINQLLDMGQTAAANSDRNLQTLILEEIEQDGTFSGSVEAQRKADELTVTTKSLFVALGIGALKLQRDGPDSLGAMILEPKSDADAKQYLRIEKLQSFIAASITSVVSTDMIARV